MGYKVKEVREAANISQEELAKKSGVSRMTIVAIENNDEYVTTTKTLLKIAKALNTTVDEIFFANGV